MKSDDLEMIPETTIDIRQIEETSIEDMVRLYKDAGWWKKDYENNLDFLPQIVKNSWHFVGAFHGSVMVGMGRALSDGVSDAYIQDVAVLKEYQGLGIGIRIVRELILALKGAGVDWIGLIGEPGTVDFYQKLGFEPLKGYVPLIYKD